LDRKAARRQAVSSNPAVNQPTAGYSGTPLLDKLGVKPGNRLALIGAPRGFAEWLPPLPEGATIRQRGDAEADVILLFLRSRKELPSIGATIRRMPAQGGMLWAVWPKKTSSIVSDLSEGAVRDAGLGAGVVDTKVCAIDETWSGLRFSRRKTK
jgi:hypothetical protein